jgi:YVTN family beta-propeller protein
MKTRQSVKDSLRGVLVATALGLFTIPMGGTDLLVILNKSDDTASILDATTGKTVATVPVGHGPHEAEVLAGGRTAVVSNYGDRSKPGRSLTLIDLEKGVPAGTIELPEGARPHGLFALADGRLLVTAEGLKELFVVDPKAGKLVLRVLTMREVSHMVVATPDGARAFVANIGSGSVTVVDLASGKVVQDVPTGQGAEGIAMTPDGREVWVCNRAADTVSVIDAKTLAVVATVKAPSFPIRVKITPDGRRALVSCAQSGDVAVFDTATRAEVKRIAIDREAVAGSSDRLFSTQFGKSPVPVGLLVAPDGKRAWVASTNADVVSAIDLGTLSVVGRLTAGKEPDGLAGRFAR